MVFLCAILIFFYSELNCPYQCIKVGGMGTLSLTQANRNGKIDNILYGVYISIVKYAYVWDRKTLSSQEGVGFRGCGLYYDWWGIIKSKDIKLPKR